MAVEVCIRDTVATALGLHIDQVRFVDVAEKVLEALEYEEWSLSILFTDDEEIAELNSAYRGINSATDVLSFAQLEGEGIVSQEKSLGDVVISVPTAVSQSVDEGHTPAVEFCQLMIHGILHLLGYEHVDVSKEEVALMRDKEAELYALVSDMLTPHS